MMNSEDRIYDVSLKVTIISSHINGQRYDFFIIHKVYQYYYWPHLHTQMLLIIKVVFVGKYTWIMYIFQKNNVKDIQMVSNVQWNYNVIIGKY